MRRQVVVFNVVIVALALLAAIVAYGATRTRVRYVEQSGVLVRITEVQVDNLDDPNQTDIPIKRTRLRIRVWEREVQRLQREASRLRAQADRNDALVAQIQALNLAPTEGP